MKKIVLFFSLLLTISAYSQRQIPKGGTTGQVLKIGADDVSVVWGTGGGTVTSVGAVGGTGVSVSGSPITSSGTFTVTNTAPDRTVTIGSGTNISVTGTYPTFTVTNTQVINATTPLAISGDTISITPGNENQVLTTVNGLPTWSDAPTSSAMVFMFSATSSSISGYKQAVALPVFTATTTATSSITATTTETVVASFATNSGNPNITKIPIGNILFHYETIKNSGSFVYYSRVKLYKYDLSNVETLLLTSDDASQTNVNTVVQNTITAYNPTAITLLTTDRLVAKVFVIMVSGSSVITARYDDATNARMELPYAVNTTVFIPYTDTTSVIQTQQQTRSNCFPYLGAIKNLNGNGKAIGNFNNMAINRLIPESGLKLDVNGNCGFGQNTLSRIYLGAGNSQIAYVSASDSMSHRKYLRLISKSVVVGDSGVFLDTVPSAALSVNSTYKGFLVPRMTTTQMNAISAPATGLLIFNTTDSSFHYRRPSSWTVLGVSSDTTKVPSPIFFAKAATTSSLTAVTYLTNTLTANANGRIGLIDGVSLDTNDVFLVKDQVSKLQNGLYRIADTGTVSSPYILVRDTLYDETSEVYPSQINVLNGTINANKYFLQQTVNPIIGTSAITYSTVANPIIPTYSVGANLISISADKWRSSTDFWVLQSGHAATITITDAPSGANVPTGKVHQFSGASNGYRMDQLIPINTAIDYYGKIWAAKISGSGIFYAGYIAYDKNLKPLKGNSGTYGYFIASAASPASTGTWYYGTIKGEGTATTTFPVGTRYIKPLIITNYTTSGVMEVAGFEISDRPMEISAGTMTIGTSTVTFTGNVITSTVTATSKASVPTVSYPSNTTDVATTAYVTSAINAIPTSTITLTGDVTGVGTNTIITTLANTSVTAGTYTLTTLTVDAKGRITNVSTGIASNLANTNLTNTAVRTFILSDVNSLTFKNGATILRGFNNIFGSADKYFSLICRSADSTMLFGVSNDNTQTLIKSRSIINFNDVNTLQLPTINGFILSDYASGTYTRFNFGNTPTWITNTTWNYNGNVNVNLGLGGTADAQFHIVGQDHATTKALTIENDIGQFSIKILNNLQILMPNLPTSAAGLPTNTLWNNSGVLSIAP